MNTRYLSLIGLCGILILSTGCSSIVPASPAPAQSSTTQPGTNTSQALFIDTDQQGPVDVSPSVARYRFTGINLALLLDANGEPLSIETPFQLPLNLFPDVTYTGVITQVTQDETGAAWVGYLDGVEYSALTLVYTAGVFIMHAASPIGSYEVTNVGGDLYRIVQIDQTQLPGGEGVIEGNPVL